MRFLLTSWGSSGDLHPFLSLARELQRRGHKVTMAGNPYWQKETSAAGIDFLPAGPEQNPSMLLEHPKILSQKYLGIESVNELMKEGVEPTLQGVYDTMLDAAPNYDCVVAHHFSFSAGMVAEKTGVPWATVILAPGVIPTRYHMPAGAYCRAFRGPVGRLMNQFLWWVGRVVIAPAVDQRINSFRRKIGLPIQKDVMFGTASKHLNLLLYSKHFAPPLPDYTPEKKMAGFCHWDPVENYEPAKQLTEFLNAGPPPWLVTMGSVVVLGSRDLYTQAVLAMKNKKERMILLAGPYAHKMRDLPPNVLALDAAPYGWLMPRCSAVAHQCGIGTISHVLRAGLPSVMCPVAFDQPNNAMRLLEQGLGVYVPARRRTAANLYAAFKDVTDGPENENAQLVGKKIRAENGPGLAADILENFVRTSGKRDNPTLALNT